MGGGGVPRAAYGGRADIMDVVAPIGPVYQAGTLSGNPLAVAAGRATLEQCTPEVYDRVDAAAETGAPPAARAAGAPPGSPRRGCTPASTPPPRRSGAWRPRR